MGIASWWCACGCGYFESSSYGGMVVSRRMIALDTNLLVYAHRAGTAEHVAAKDVILQVARNPAGWGTSVSCIAEFWAVVTHLWTNDKHFVALPGLSVITPLLGHP